MRIEEFQIVKKIGAGATSDVFLAMDTNGNSRALKVFNHCLSEEQGMQTFERELKHLSRIKNDRIVQVYELGHGKNGERYLVQEFVEGINLKEFLLEERHHLDRLFFAIYLCSEILYGLDEAHEKGIIHRDIKPENIIVGEDARVVITDFGLSKDIFSDEKTLHGSLFGSPQFMSPKQFSDEQIDESVDLYAVAVLLYEMIAGQLPFEGRSIDSLIEQKRSGDFVDLSKHNPYLPESLAEIIHSILRSDDHAPKRAYEFRFLLLKSVESFGYSRELARNLVSKKLSTLDSVVQANWTEKLIRSLEELLVKNQKNSRMVNRLEGRLIRLSPQYKFEKKKNRIPLLIILFLLPLFILGGGYLFREENFQKNKMGSQPLSPKIEKKVFKPVEEPKLTTIENKPILKDVAVKAPIKAVESKKKILPKKTNRVVKREQSPVKTPVGYLIVNIPSDIKVFLDDRRIYEIGKKISLKPGEYELTLAKDGYPSMSSQIEILEGKDTLINLD